MFDDAAAQVEVPSGRSRRIWLAGLAAFFLGVSVLFAGIAFKGAVKLAARPINSSISQLTN